MLKDLKFICHLDGYNYYLGGVVAEDVSLYEALDLVKEMGEGWELPSRAVAILAHNKLQEEMQSVDGWYWLGDEHSPSSAWLQCSAFGFQYNGNKVNTFSRYVRPVYKEKVA